MGTKKCTLGCWQCPQVLRREQQGWIPLQDVPQGSCTWAPGHAPGDPGELCCSSPLCQAVTWGSCSGNRPDSTSTTTELSHFPFPTSVTHMEGFVHRGQDKQATCSLPQGTRYKVIKPWNSFSDISTGRVPTAHKKKIHSSGSGLQDELQELFCAHPLLEVLTCPSDLKIHGWLLFTVAELR